MDWNLKQKFMGWNRACLHNMSLIDGPARGSIDLWRLKILFQFSLPLIHCIGRSVCESSWHSTDAR